MKLTHSQCIQHLEEIRWGTTPICPYCTSKTSTPIPQENRYHCSYCYTSYSVKVGTIFHRSHISLEKWYKAIFLFSTTKELSIRQLAKEISVTNKTASSMITKIKEADKDSPKLLKKIKDFYLKHTRNSQR